VTTRGQVKNYFPMQQTSPVLTGYLYLWQLTGICLAVTVNFIEVQKQNYMLLVEPVPFS